MAECRLCKQDRRLRRSHIIPEFCYDATYGPRHTGNLLKISGAKKLKFQVGLRERLLCDACEQLLNDHYEKYFLSVWYDKSLIPSVIPPGEFTVCGLDYRRFKLFHLSVLWRASIASRPEFRNVRLGVHEEKIRMMLLSGDPGRPDQYGLWCYLVVLPTTNEVLHGVVLEPSMYRVHDHHVYIFVYGGAVWFQVVSSHKKDDFLPSLFDTSGKLRTRVLTIDQDNIIKDAFFRFFDATKKLGK